MIFVPASATQTKTKKAVDGSEAVVVLVSDSSVEAPEIYGEIGWALERVRTSTYRPRDSTTEGF